MAQKKQLSPRAQRIIGNILIILSVVAGLFAGDQLVKSIHMRSEWNKTEAVVTRLEPIRGRRGRVSYAAWFSFHDPITHRSYSVKSKVNSNPPAFKVREKVELLYPSDNPEDAVANTFLEVYFYSLFLGGAFVVLGFLGLALRFGKGSKSQDESTTDTPQDAPEKAEESSQS